MQHTYLISMHYENIEKLQNKKVTVIKNHRVWTDRQTSEVGTDKVSPSAEGLCDVWLSCDGVGDTRATTYYITHL